MEELLKQYRIIKPRSKLSLQLMKNGQKNSAYKWLGTKGLVKNLMGEMKNVPNEKKKEFGQILMNSSNSLKQV
jgi:phenylalanyl-tRNA synthetase alpha chain